MPEQVAPPAERVHRKGAVTRILVRNFLTYDNVEVRPGPGFNIIMGPNGSGKSTLLCALALGLGGTIGESRLLIFMHA
jgi:structural maintenance of chromosomes protein 5